MTWLSRYKTISIIVFILFLGVFSADSGAEPVRVGHLEAELVAEVKTISPGQSFRAGLWLRMDEHWHVYWRNPGDAGTPPKITWELPEGFKADEINWPAPERIEVPPLTSFGYHGQLLLPVEITPPNNLENGAAVILKARAEWLVCKEKCIPGEAELELKLTVSENEPVFDNKRAPLFAETGNHLPLENSEWTFSAQPTGREIVMTLNPPAGFSDSLEEVYFFPFEKGLIDNAAEQVLTATASGYEMSIKRSPYSIEDPSIISGLLVTETGWRGKNSEKALQIYIPIDKNDNAVGALTESVSGNIWKALLFAFLGGLILNLMPCVLPVLSLKILGFVQHAGQGRSRTVGHGLIFTAGVLVSFWLLAGALLALRAGGEQLGWGFQLQSPAFLLILSSFMFLFGLNLLGVFEIGTGLAGLGSGNATRSGWLGSFINGVTATVVATPCTAPFMGSALGFSLSQPAGTAMLIFTFLGLGMAAPYLVFSAFPALLKILPRPGRWMETLKQVMGFLLLATVIWLSWVLGIQAGSNAVAALLITLLLLGLAAWIYGRWGTIAENTRRRVIASLAALILIAGGVGFGLVTVGLSTPNSNLSAVTKTGSITWESFSPEKVEQLQAAGRAVFIDFTAAWCLSCQVNEQVAFGSSEVREKFAELGIAALKADWTRRDETITRALAEFGRNSVPLYVLFGPGNKHDPIILPEILTPGLVLEALSKIENRRD